MSRRGAAAAAAAVANMTEDSNGKSRGGKRGGDATNGSATKKSKAESGAAAAVPAAAVDASKQTLQGAHALERKVKDSNPNDPYTYHHGLGNEVESEAIPNTLPIAQATPQKCAYGLYAEQLSGTSFTTPRVFNQRTWFYRIRPSIVHKPYVKYTGKTLISNDASKMHAFPSQTRWKPFPLPPNDKKVDFIDGMATLAGAGSPDIKAGIAIHIYACNTSMVDRCFCNSDGDFLIVPQQGTLDVRTECGLMSVAPGEICVIQRGIKFAVRVEGPTRGYICEVYNGHFRIPDLGPIGTTGLAMARDFMIPKAAYEDREGKYTMVSKYLGELFTVEYGHSPFDVVAWFGNYAPYKYDLARFIVVNSVSVDHLDPCIFTVLTCPTAEAGVAACDFAIFPPRWCVQEHTFRPPYYHRNVMSEFMGNIKGQYDAKPDGFNPGAGSFHHVMTAHGPDAGAFEKATHADLKPAYLGDMLAFMFESTYILKYTDWAIKTGVDEHYYKCWEGIQRHFQPPQ